MAYSVLDVLFMETPPLLYEHENGCGKVSMGFQNLGYLIHQKDKLSVVLLQVLLLFCT